MHFDLVLTVQRGLFVYLHELAHVCQAPELARRMRAGDAGAVSRWHVFGEIEAYARMDAAYASLVRHSPRLCREEVRENPADLSAVYIETNETLASGRHAQMIVAAHLESYKDEAKYFFDSAAPKVRYLDRQGEPFELGRLHPELAELIRRAGIPLIE